MTVIDPQQRKAPAPHDGSPSRRDALWRTAVHLLGAVVCLGNLWLIVKVHVTYGLITDEYNIDMPAVSLGEAALALTSAAYLVGLAIIALRAVLRGLRIDAAR